MSANAGPRLAWQCRRGLLELDLLLQPFLEEGYPGLGPAERRAFEELLCLPDPLLLEYLVGTSTPPEPGMAHVAAQIRRTALHRP